eukprot:778279-Pelagomonas_calceolata.AAC.3
MTADTWCEDYMENWKGVPTPGCYSATPPPPQTKNGCKVGCNAIKNFLLDSPYSQNVEHAEGACRRAPATLSNNMCGMA